jgi:hypothetical protein
MYIANNTGVPILYTVVGGPVAHGTILPGQGKEIESGEALTVNLTTDDGAPLPATLVVTLTA